MSQKIANKADEKSSRELPPKREGKAIRTDLPLPLQNTSLSTVVYWISGGALLYLAYYAYLITLWKTEAGGWLNLAIGRHSEPESTRNAKVPFGSDSKYAQHKDDAGKLLENRISELAIQLGIEPKELASAIKPLIPRPTASALNADPEATGTIADVLSEDAKVEAEAAAAAANLGGDGILGTFVGLEEPPSDIPV